MGGMNSKNVLALVGHRSLCLCLEIEMPHNYTKEAALLAVEKMYKRGH